MTKQAAGGLSVLVVGSRGYIGPVVCSSLREAGAQVLEVDAGWFSPVESTPTSRLADIRSVALDDFDVVPDAIIFLAAVSNDPMGLHHEEATFSVNVDAAVQIAEQAKELGVAKFIYASSCSIYGKAGDRAVREDDPLEPLTAYARSKVDAENALHALAAESFQVFCLRLATACGSSPNIRLDLVLNDFVASALHEKRIELLSDGTPWRPLINVEDIARAFVWAAYSDLSHDFLAVNVGSEAFTYRIRDLAESVAQLVPGTEVAVSSSPSTDNRSYTVDFSLFRELAPSAQPQFDLRSTVEQLSAQIASLDVGADGFRSNPTFIRLLGLAQLLRDGQYDNVLMPLNR